MMVLLRRACATILILLSFFGPDAGDAQAQSRETQRLIVRLERGENPGRVLSDYAEEYGYRSAYVYRYVIQGFAIDVSIDQTEEALQAFSKDPRVLDVEFDEVVSLDPDEREFAPRDDYQLNEPQLEPRLSWGIDRIDQRELPLDGQFAIEGDGRGVTVYVVDTGIRYDHSEFYDGFRSRAQFGFDAFDGSGGDCSGHGTHVAGIIAGRIHGVAKKAEVISVRVLNCAGYGSKSSVLAGLDWVAKNHARPAVVNLSFVGPPSEIWDEAIRSLVEDGITITAAAGNAARNACNYSPARVENIITVGNSNEVDSRSPGSNYGECVDLFAPGARIRAASISGINITALRSGTSQAAPHVAGVAALILQKDAGVTPEKMMQIIDSLLTRGIVTNAYTFRNHLLYIDSDLIP